MNRAIPEIIIPAFPKERTRLREIGKYPFVIEKRTKTFGHFHRVSFPGIFIPDEKSIIGYLLLNDPHQTKMTTALPALHTFKSQKKTSLYSDFGMKTI